MGCNAALWILECSTHKHTPKPCPAHLLVYNPLVALFISTYHVATRFGFRHGMLAHCTLDAVTTMPDCPFFPHALPMRFLQFNNFKYVMFIVYGYGTVHFAITSICWMQPAILSKMPPSYSHFNLADNASTWMPGKSNLFGHGFLLAPTNMPRSLITLM